MFDSETEVLKALREAVDGVAGEDPDRLFDDQVTTAVVALSRLQRRLEAQRLRLVAELDRRRLAVQEGHPSTASWLAHLTGASWNAAGGDVALARGLETMPHTTEAFRTGDLDRTRARRLAWARRDEPDLFARDEHALVDSATTLNARDFARAVDYWRQAAAPEVLTDETEARHRRRRLHISETYEGMVRIDGDLDPEGGDIVRIALASLTEAASRRNDSNADARTPAQLRADALVDVCRHHLDHGATPTTGGRRPHVTVTIDLQVLHGSGTGVCETDRGDVLDAETARRIACDASITRVITSGPSQILDVGRSTRTIPTAIRTALVVRDRGCTWSGCDRPARWCDAHHIDHWAQGGATTLDNLTLLCRHHHRLTHQEQRSPPTAHSPPQQQAA
ncbi:MAG: DUF222 domain-containing protein [Acidimicrobiia bacterium]